MPPRSPPCKKRVSRQPNLLVTVAAVRTAIALLVAAAVLVGRAILRLLCLALLLLVISVAGKAAAESTEDPVVHHVPGHRTGKAAADTANGLRLRLEAHGGHRKHG